jgi:hypothetical protein
VGEPGTPAPLADQVGRVPLTGASGRLPAGLAYVAPFAIFLGLLELSRIVSFSQLVIQAGFVGTMLAVLWLVARQAPDLQSGFRLRHFLPSALLGIAVFAAWIAPDLLFPGYRHGWLFENALTGSAVAGFPADARQPAVLWLRALRACIVVPIVEELFWRAWLMRWIVAPEFLKIPLGSWSPRAFWIVAALFASEHGSFWAVGLLAGVLYNWWMIRTKSLADVMLAHAVTNACLSLYVVVAGKWEYWL